MKRLYLLILMFFPLLLFSQSPIEYEDFNDIFKIEKGHNHWSSQLKNNNNELEFLFSFLFVIYKEIFSSQDMDSCVFEPSCSVYAIESIKKKGFLKGLLNSLDRLSRCNPGQHKDCPINPKTNKFIDPVE